MQLDNLSIAKKLNRGMSEHSSNKTINDKIIAKNKKVV